MRIVQRALLTCAVAATCGCAGFSQQTNAPATQAASDWPTFGGSNARTNANMAPTKITAANVGSMVRQQVKISAPIDAGLIYLKGVKVNGASHDVYFGTTNVGRTVAIDANDGTVLWEYAPPGFDEVAAATGVPTGSRGLIVKQITNSTPVADANRQFIYAAAADGKVTKICDRRWQGSVEHCGDPHADPGEAGFALVVRPRERAGAHRRLCGRYAPVPGSHRGARCEDRGDTQGMEFPLQRSRRAAGSGFLCADSVRHLGTRRHRGCARHRNLLFATGNGPWDGKTAWGDAVIMLDPSATKMLGNWTTTNNEELNKKDLDVGSTSPVLLGDGYIAQGGKDGTIRLLSMDVIKGTAPHQGGELQVVEVPGKTQLLSGSATAKIGGTTYLFASTGRGGTTAWTFGADHQLKEAWKTKTGGNTPFYAGGLLYIYDPAPRGAKLHVFDAVSGNPVADLDTGSRTLEQRDRRG